MPFDPVKIILRNPDGEIETLWAEPTGVDGEYVLDNLPWLAYGVSLGDTVEARPAEGGGLEMTRVIRKSGNRNLRVILETEESSHQWTPESRALIEKLKALGCGYEGLDSVLIAILVPPEVDLLAIGDEIDAAGFKFEYADPTYEDLFPEEAVGP